MIAEVREKRDLYHDRKFVFYELEEAPEGHGGLPRPRDVSASIVEVSHLELDDVRDPWGIRTECYRKELKASWSELEDGTIEITEYQVWVPCEWEY